METIQTAATGDPQRLRTLIPLESLGPESFERVASAMKLKPVKAGTLLFQLGKRNDYCLYLLEGSVELSAFDETQQVDAGSERARRPLVDMKPHQFNGTALTDCIVALIDGALMENCMTWDQMVARPVPGYEIQEFEGTADVDWMLQMLQSRVFTRLPTANIQSLFSRFEEFPVPEGQVVVTQGEPGEYYYIVKQGRCRVSRRGEAGGDSALAELGPGDAFGEESLLSDEPRNATVTMLSDGVLMRLAKSDFHTLMTEPLLKRVDPIQAADMRKNGAVFLDVRLESEFRHGRIEGAGNLPLYLLRLKASSLDPSSRYVVVCDTGARSAAAAFLLGERGLDVSILEGGLASLGP